MDKATVYVIDDDDAVRQAVSFLLRAAHLQVEAFDSALDFLDRYEADSPGCLVLDLQMPHMDGLSLQSALVEHNITLPIVFLTGHGDVSTAVRAIQDGAVDFLEKPFASDKLLQCVKRALETDAQGRAQRSQAQVLEDRLERLTSREREILDQVVGGKANKVIASELGISERTVELHRSRVMRKLEARSLAELIKLFPPES